MTVNVKLNGDPVAKTGVFAAGGLFAGVPASRAVLTLGSGRDDRYLGKINMNPASSLSYRGGQTSLMVDSRGTEFSDYTFESIMQESLYRATYGVQILDFVERGLIEVYQDQLLLTPAQIATFTA